MSIRFFSFKSIVKVYIVLVLSLSSIPFSFCLDNGSNGSNATGDIDSSYDSKDFCIDKFSNINDSNTKNSYHKLFSKIKGHLFLLTTVGAE